MDTKELTMSQANALKVFASLNAPTLQEWADAMDVTFTAANYYRAILVKRGFLTSEPGKARSTRTTASARKFLKGMK